MRKKYKMHNKFSFSFVQQSKFYLLIFDNIFLKNIQKSWKRVKVTFTDLKCMKNTSEEFLMTLHFFAEFSLFDLISFDNLACHAKNNFRNGTCHSLLDCDSKGQFIDTGEKYRSPSLEYSRAGQRPACGPLTDRQEP